ncbi:pectin lyase-like superfamily protein [Actinidia rufa]|uniref:Pectin lyase-like superfamily protein n=1 Tax=Actinidia rufa TaxID=165716 RepID=A0A7J0EXX0_9ERIC|nr:pectin lyase-like superfamily protein [Actinidia rufa]
MFTKTNLGGEESEQSLPSWISDHLGAKSYIDETSQSPSSPPPNSPKMDTLSLTKEGNVMTQAELDKLGSTYSFPSGACTPSAPLPDSGWFYFKARPDKNLFRGSPSNVKGWKTRFFFASGDEWEFPSGTAASNTLRVPRSWGTPGKSCNKLPTLSEVDAKRTGRGPREDRSRRLLRGVEGYRMGGKESLSWRPRRDPPKVAWGKVKNPFTNLRPGTTSGFSSGSGSDSISDSELPPELRSDAMSARAGAPTFGEKTGGKAKAEKATTAKPPTKGIVIREKRTREGVPVIEIGEPDSSKGKEAAPPPAPKRFKSNRGAINARRPAAGRGTSSPGGDVGSESMSDASVARRLLSQGRRSWPLRTSKPRENSRAAVTDSAATYFSEGFEFCKRQLLHQFPKPRHRRGEYGDGPKFCRGRGGDKGRRRSCPRSCSQCTTNLWVENVACGPGHGISIGSLGKDFREPGVQNVTVKTVTFTGAQNGVRIKTWGRPSNGFVRGVLFQHIDMVNVKNPILIDQNYCPSNKGCPGQASGVKISDVTYLDIHGTSATKIAVKFECSQAHPCSGIRLEDVKLTYKNEPAHASCANADGTASGFVEPTSCL